MVCLDKCTALVSLLPQDGASGFSQSSPVRKKGLELCDVHAPNQGLVEPVRKCATC